MSTPSRPTAPPRARRGHGRVTLRDVAAAAGVTAITVSRCLRSPGQVAPETAARIQAAVAATGYVPNKQAGLLASGHGSIVAALVPNLAHSIFAETLQGLSDVLGAAGLELLVASSGYSLAREEAQVRALLGWRPRALIVTGRHHAPGAQALLRQAHAGGCTVVEMWDQHPRAAGGFAQVGFNHRAAGRTMARHLLALGHRRLAYVDSAVEGDYRARERGDGFVAEAAAAGAAAQRLTAPAGEPVQAGRAVPAMLRALAPPPTACGLANDHLACGALLGAQAAGVAVPGELALLGFGDFELAAHLAPGLSTLAPPRREIGEHAAALPTGLPAGGAGQHGRDRDGLSAQPSDAGPTWPKASQPPSTASTSPVT
jgi:LacI family transcriptional regulator, gluconate utilization system Gnt-I transcriptional repressor